MGYTLTAAVPTDETVLLQRAHGVQLTVTSDNATLYPPKVFVMQQPADPTDDPYFNCIANAIQMQDLPEDAVDPEIDEVLQPYFRVAVLTVISRTATGIADFIARVQEDLAMLESDLDNLETLNNP